MDSKKISAAKALAIAHLIMDGLTWNEAREAVNEDYEGPMPNAQEIESTLRSELYLLEPDHAALLEAWRELARYLMQRIELPLYLSGAVLNGSATVHSNLRLVTFTDNSKDVEIALMNAGLDYEVIESEITKPVAQIAYGWLMPLPRTSIFRQKDKYLHALGVRLEVFDPIDRARWNFETTPDAHQDPLEAKGLINSQQLEALLEKNRVF